MLEKLSRGFQRSINVFFLGTQILHLYGLQVRRHMHSCENGIKEEWVSRCRIIDIIDNRRIQKEVLYFSSHCLPRKKENHVGCKAFEEYGINEYTKVIWTAKYNPTWAFECPWQLFYPCENWMNDSWGVLWSALTLP